MKRYQWMLLVVMSVVLIAGLTNFPAVTNKVVSSLWPKNENPIPTLVMHPREYRVTVVADGQLTGRQTTSVMTPVVHTSLKVGWLVEDGTLVREGDPLIRFDDTDAVVALQKNETDVASLSQRIEKNAADKESQLNRLRMEHQEAELEHQFASNQIRKDDSIFSRWEIEESLISAALAQYKKENVQQQSSLHQELSQADLEILQIDQGKAQTEVDRAEKTLSSLIVRAPTDGVALQRRGGFWRLEVGREVWPGQPLMEVAALSEFEGEVHVVETDVAGVEAGRPVTFRLKAIPDRALTGTVRSISKVAEQINRKDPRRYFTCTVTLDVPDDLLEELRPGMQFQAEIEVNQRKSAYVLPKSAVFNRDGQFEVFLESGGEFEKRKVEILESDHGFFVVDGLEEGLRVCLRHPLEKEQLHLPDFNAPSRASSGQRFVFFF